MDSTDCLRVLLTRTFIVYGRIVLSACVLVTEKCPNNHSGTCCRPTDTGDVSRVWEPYNDALAQALTCGLLWSGVTRLTVTDPGLWHACGTTPGLAHASRGVISRIEIKHALPVRDGYLAVVEPTTF